MTILVVGASGVLGRRVVPLLLLQGRAVTAVGRSPERLAPLAALGASVATASLFDRAAMMRVMRGHEAVVNLATQVPGTGLRAFLPGAWAGMDRVRRQGSAMLADAAIALGVERFVQESFALTYPDAGDRWVDETCPVRPAPYNRTTVDAEMSAARVTRAGGVGVALRFALLYGPGDAFTHDVFRSVQRGWLPLFGRPDGYVPIVAHHDAARAVVSALAVPAGVYNVVDDEPLTRRALGDAIAAIVGARPPKLPPPWAAKLGRSVGETIARSLRLSNRKLREAGRWSPEYPSAREGWRAAYTSFVPAAGGAHAPAEAVDA
jgi:nucleoside-diphosphate-sugar epimerase